MGQPSISNPVERPIAAPAPGASTPTKPPEPEERKFLGKTVGQHVKDVIQFFLVDPVECILGSQCGYAGAAMAVIIHRGGGGALGKELRAAEEAEAEAAKAAAKVEADAAAAAEAEALRAAEGAAKPSATPNFSDPSKAPSADFEWKGRDPNTPGRKGNWVNPKTGEKFNPDLNHPGPIGPHYDYTDPSGGQWRVFPDGRIMPK